MATSCWVGTDRLLNKINVRAYQGCGPASKAVVSESATGISACGYKCEHKYAFAFNLCGRKRTHDWDRLPEPITKRPTADVSSHQVDRWPYAVLVCNTHAVRYTRRVLPRRAFPPVRISPAPGIWFPFDLTLPGVRVTESRSHHHLHPDWKPPAVRMVQLPTLKPFSMFVDTQGGAPSTGVPSFVFVAIRR